MKIKNNIEIKEYKFNIICNTTFYYFKLNNRYLFNLYWLNYE